MRNYSNHWNHTLFRITSRFVIKNPLRRLHAHGSSNRSTALPPTVPPIGDQGSGSLLSTSHTLCQKSYSELDCRPAERGCRGIQKYRLTRGSDGPLRIVCCPAAERYVSFNLGLSLCVEWISGRGRVRGGEFRRRSGSQFITLSPGNQQGVGYGQHHWTDEKTDRAKCDEAANHARGDK